MLRYFKAILTLLSFVSCHAVMATEATPPATTLEIPMQLMIVGLENTPIGTVTAQDTEYGLLLTPNLKSLSPGIHGFHVHQNPSCAQNGKAAGGHLDPAGANKHLGPYNAKGHLGDLPALVVNKQGQALIPILAPRLKTSDLAKRALIIHLKGDNYSDHPKALGGGGNRIACGVIE